MLILLTFRQLPQTFFQQDEWLGLGALMSIGWKSVTRDISPLQFLFADGRPFTRVLAYVFYRSFSDDSLHYAVYSIVLHSINTILVYFTVNKFVKNKLFALLGSSYFAVADVAHQSVTWFGASFGEQPASLLVFSSVLLFLLFTETKRKILLYASFLLAVVSIYFKESGIFLIPLFTIILFFLRKKIPVKSYSSAYIPLAVFFAAFIIVRFIGLATSSMAYQPSVYINSSSQNIVLTMLLRAILYPLTSLSLSFTPYPVAAFLSEWLWKLYYPFIVQRPDLVFQTVVLDLIAITFSGLLLVLCYVFIKRKEYIMPVIFALLFFVLSLLPYIAIAKQYAYLEPRYYYISLLSCSIIIATLFSYLSRPKKNFVKILFVCSIVLYLAYLRYNVAIVRHDIAVQIDIANERKSFINQLYGYYPTLHNDTNIFLFTGNQPYVAENNFTPFQNGFGYTLMVLYYKSGKIPTYLPSTKYLWSFGDEGIKTINGKTYGYFNNIRDLKEQLEKKKIDPVYVYAFYYNAHSKKLTDVTQQTREELSNEDN